MDELPSDILSLLGPNEHVEFYIQQKTYYPTTNINSVALTNERILFRHPHDLGLKTDFTDLSYSDITDVSLEQGMLRSTLTCFLKSNGGSFRLSDLANEDAQQAYGVIRRNMAQSQTGYRSNFTAAKPTGTSPLLQQAHTPTSSSAQAPILKEIIREVVLVACPHCGTRSPQGTVKCQTCGASL